MSWNIPNGDVVSETSSGQSQLTSEASPTPGSASRRAANEYLAQLSYMLAEREERKGRERSRGRHRERQPSPPTKDPSAVGSGERRTCRHQPPPVDMDGSQMQRFARNESKLVELQAYLGGIRQHLQKMAMDLDSPPARPRPAPAAQGVVFSPWQHQQKTRGRSTSGHRRHHPALPLRF